MKTSLSDFVHRFEAARGEIIAAAEDLEDALNKFRALQQECDDLRDFLNRVRSVDPNEPAADIVNALADIELPDDFTFKEVLPAEDN